MLQKCQKLHFFLLLKTQAIQESYTHTHTHTQYLQCLAGSTCGDLGSTVGEAGRVDGALVGVDHQTGQTLYTVFIPENKQINT